MTVDHQIALLKRMLEASVECGRAGLNGPYCTTTDDNFEAISDFIFSFPDNVTVSKPDTEIVDKTEVKSNE